MIEISNNDAFGVVKGGLRVFKRHTMLFLIEEVLFLIPFKAWFWHFLLPYNYMGPYDTEALLVNVLRATYPIEAISDKPLCLMIKTACCSERDLPTAPIDSVGAATPPHEQWQLPPHGRVA